MDFVPFTIFFMVCLMVFYENLASPYGCRESREWPKGCADKAYCLKMPTNYPTTTEFKKMLDNSGIDISTLETPKPIDRSGNELCRQYYMFDPIYAIKDTKGAVRIVVQDPNLYIQRVTISPCKVQVDLPPLTTCEEVQAPSELLVMTCDGEGVEKLKFQIPSGCSVQQVDDYDDD